MDTGYDIASLLGSLAIFLVLGLCCYVYSAVVIGILARKTATEAPWMAWVPILNMVLLCRIGRRPGIAVLGLFIPFVNLAVLVWIFIGVAEARRKSTVSAFLMLIPLVNFAVLAWLASGDATAAPAAAYAAPAAAYAAPGTGYAPPPGSGYAQPSAAANPPQGSARPTACAYCGDPFEPGEQFCGNCGTAATPAPASTPPAGAPPGSYPQVQTASSPIPKVAAAVGAVLLALGGGAFGISRYILPMLSGTSGSTPVAQRAPGTLTEFPVDTDKKSPAKPVAVSSTNLQTGSRTQPTPPNLPAGVTASTLAACAAQSVTTATYQSPDSPAPVAVSVIESSTPGAAEAPLIEAITNGSGGVAETTGVQVASPTGQVYKGRKIRTVLGAVVFVLSKIGSAITLVIHSAQPGGAALAERLAANVGNGAGLYDYAGNRGSVSLLPSSPAGLVLTEMKSYAASDLTAISDLQRTLGAEAQSIRRYIPDRLVSARYSDQNRREWKMLAGEFGGAMRAWATWSALRLTSGVSGVQPVAVADGEGLTLLQQGERFLLWRDGSRLILLVAPAAEPIERIAQVGNTIRF